jgi:hypothetical protein
MAVEHVLNANMEQRGKTERERDKSTEKGVQDHVRQV